MRILIFSMERNSCESIKDTVRKTQAGKRIDPAFFCIHDYDCLRRDLTVSAYDLVIVAEPGARGMEVCIGIRKLRPHIPMFWFSDDPMFAAQSYRLNCTYFGQHPASEGMMENAFGRLCPAERRNRG